MPNDYYPVAGDEADPAAAPQGADGQAPKDQNPEEESNEQTALIPKGLLAGKNFEPGEEVTFKIVKMHDDEVEIAYATDEGSEPTEPGADDSAMGKADKQLSMMGQ